MTPEEKRRAAELLEEYADELELDRRWSKPAVERAMREARDLAAKLEAEAGHV